MLGGSLKTLAFEPIATSKLAVGLGLGDVMTLLDIAISHGGFPRPLVFSVVGILGLICALAAAIWIWRDQRLDERMRFAVAIIMTLLCFKHLEYDFVVLVVPVAAAAMAPKSKARTVVMLCMAYFWFATSIVNRFFPKRVYAPEVMIYAVMLLVMAISTSRLYPGPPPEQGFEVVEA
jgi:hypothetical protein